MAFPVAAPVAGQGMVSTALRQRFIVDELSDNGIQQSFNSL